MDANKIQPLAELGATEGAKLVPGIAAFSVYGLTLEKWALLLPVLYYVCLLLDLVFRRWIWPLAVLLRDRNKPAPEVLPDDVD
jgi:hypothetical protein